MATTTVRVDVETHALLVELGASAGTNLMDTVREAAEALRRQRFARTVVDELAELRRDEHEWADYLAEAESSHVSDGLD